MDRFPHHDKINFDMSHILSKNIDASIAHVPHARETLDDVIADLIQYRDSIATVAEYADWNYL